MNSDDETNKLTRYQTLMNHRQHAERVFWSRIQTLHVIQAAVLGGGYFLWKDDELGLSVALVFIGILLTLLLGRLTFNDWRDASVNDHLMHKLGDELVIRRTADRHCLKSHSILYFIVAFFLIIDIGFILFLFVV